MAGKVQDDGEQQAEQDGGGHQWQEVVIYPRKVDRLPVEAKVVHGRQCGSQIVVPCTSLPVVMHPNMLKRASCQMCARLVYFSHKQAFDDSVLTPIPAAPIVLSKIEHLNARAEEQINRMSGSMSASPWDKDAAFIHGNSSNITDTAKILLHLLTDSANPSPQCFIQANTVLERLYCSGWPDITLRWRGTD